MSESESVTDITDSANEAPIQYGSPTNFREMKVTSWTPPRDEHTSLTATAERSGSQHRATPLSFSLGNSSPETEERSSAEQKEDTPQVVIVPPEEGDEERSQTPAITDQKKNFQSPSLSNSKSRRTSSSRKDSGKKAKTSNSYRDEQFQYVSILESDAENPTVVDEANSKSPVKPKRKSEEGSRVHRAIGPPRTSLGRSPQNKNTDGMESFDVRKPEDLSEPEQEAEDAEPKSPTKTEAQIVIPKSSTKVEKQKNIDPGSTTKPKKKTGRSKSPTKKETEDMEPESTTKPETTKPQTKKGAKGKAAATTGKSAKGAEPTKKPRKTPGPKKDSELEVDPPYNPQPSAIVKSGTGRKRNAASNDDKSGGPAKSGKKSKTSQAKDGKQVKGKAPGKRKRSPSPEDNSRSPTPTRGRPAKRSSPNPPETRTSKKPPPKTNPISTKGKPKQGKLDSVAIQNQPFQEKPIAVKRSSSPEPQGIKLPDHKGKVVTVGKGKVTLLNINEKIRNNLTRAVSELRTNIEYMETVGITGITDQNIKRKKKGTDVQYTNFQYNIAKFRLSEALTGLQQLLLHFDIYEAAKVVHDRFEALCSLFHKVDSATKENLSTVLSSYLSRDPFFCDVTRMNFIVLKKGKVVNREATLEEVDKLNYYSPNPEVDGLYWVEDPFNGDLPRKMEVKNLTSHSREQTKPVFMSKVEVALRHGTRGDNRMLVFPMLLDTGCSRHISGMPADITLIDPLYENQSPRAMNFLLADGRTSGPQLVYPLRARIVDEHRHPLCAWEPVWYSVMNNASERLFNPVEWQSFYAAVQPRAPEGGRDPSVTITLSNDWSEAPKVG